VSEAARADSRERQEQLVDATLAIFAALFCLLLFFTAERTPESAREADLLGAVLVGAAAATLAVRRRWPLAVLTAVSTLTIAVYVLDYPDSGLPVVVAVALYTVAWRCGRRTTVVATALLLLVVVSVIADAGEIDGGTQVAIVAVYVATAAFGDRRKLHDAYDEQVELRAVERERRQVEAARRAITDERLRIARELHDVVAHAMSVVAVQSGVGAHVIDKRPDEAKRILETISDTSRGSLEEMRRLLGVLRDEPEVDGDGADLTPAPGLAGLEDLAARVTDAGVPVTVVVEGERAALPAGVDLAGYRIVQEALTNVLRHAGTATAEVRVRYEDGCVNLEVLDDGRGAASGTGDPHPLSTGHGLVGMRERAALYGGTLEAGPRPGGGYRVAATLWSTPS
jgi:signal transduction histidine kinase